jgi:hypothetical protein
MVLLAPDGENTEHKLNESHQRPIEGLLDKDTRERGDGNVDPPRDYADSPFWVSIAAITVELSKTEKSTI